MSNFMSMYSMNKNKYKHNFKNFIWDSALLTVTLKYIFPIRYLNYILHIKHVACVSRTIAINHFICLKLFYFMVPGFFIYDWLLNYTNLIWCSENCIKIHFYVYAFFILMWDFKGTSTIYFSRVVKSVLSGLRTDQSSRADVSELCEFASVIYKRH